jgi:hypothetical protein
LQPKPHKLPIDPLTGGLAATIRPATWSSAGDANAAAQKWALTGIGFVFSDSDPYGGVDFDNCRNPETGQIVEWAWEIIRELSSYTEISPSGTGIHTIVRGKLPAGKGNQAAYRGGKVEMFSRERYFTFTGNLVESAPSDIRDRHAELLALHDKLFNSRKHLDATVIPSPVPSVADDDELIAKAKSARNGAKFERLWNGDWESEYPSQSEADSALCTHLAFWTGKDLARMDALFRRSGLMPKKWLRSGYRDKTLANAIAITTETWNPSQHVRLERTARGGSFFAPGAGHSSPAASAPIWEPPIPFHQIDLPQFPIDALPGWLRSFVEAEATATQTPLDLAALLSLSVLAACYAKKVAFSMREGFVEPVNIFTATALASGNRKSAVFTAMTEPLADHERAEAQRTSKEIAKQRAEHQIKESILKNLKGQAASAKGKDRDRLTQEAAELAAELETTSAASPTRYIADDCTAERLATLLRDQGGRIAVMSPEGDVFDLMAGRYSAKGMGNFGVFLKGHAGDTLRIDRVGRSEFVNAPAITVGLAVQPDVIRGLAEKPEFAGGVSSRDSYYALPKSLLGQRDVDAATVPDEIREGYHANVTALLNLPFGSDGSGDREPHLLRLTADAQASLRDFAMWLEPQLSEFGELGGMTDWAGKLVGAVGRIRRPFAHGPPGPYERALGGYHPGHYR